MSDVRSKGVAESSAASDDGTTRPVREFDVVVLGATGFTGRLAVDQVVAAARRIRPALQWAVSGRDEARRAGRSPS